MSEARRLRELEGESGKLKRLLAEAMLDVEAFKVTAGSLWIMRRLYPSQRPGSAAGRVADCPLQPVVRLPHQKAHRVVYPPLAKIVCPVIHHPSVARNLMMGTIFSILVRSPFMACDLW